MEFGEVLPGAVYRKRDAVYAVIWDGKKEKAAVMVQNGKGFLPGGGMKGSEEKQICLMRECIEETGFLLNVDYFIGNAKQYFLTRTNEYIMNNSYFYSGSFGDYVKPPIEDDHELVWMNLDEAELIIFHESHLWAVKEALLKEKR